MVPVEVSESHSEPRFSDWGNPSPDVTCGTVSQILFQVPIDCIVDHAFMMVDKGYPNG
ncbi:hypothetical protein EPIB2_668 [Tritonibacter mobilis]|nr:hypothetical protein EPIB2_668 [Tritonibacter mobilis]